MHWLMALLGAFLGAIVGGGGSVLTGLVSGALLGWQWGRLREVRQRLDAVEGRLRTEAAIRTAQEAAKRADGAMPAAAAPVVAAQKESVDPAPSPARADADRIGAGPAAAAMARQTSSPAPAAAAAASAASSHPVTPIAALFQAPPEPAPPNLLERAFERARAWLFTGNVPVKIGILVLLFGVAAALKYSVEAGWVEVSLPARMAMIAAGGLAAILWGWRNRIARPAFGLSLQGGGIGVLLLTVFAAYRLDGLLPAGIAFALVLVLVAGAAALAVLQNTMALAVLGFLGGYLAPVLLSTGSGNHVALFSFYAVLNFAVFAIAWLRHWRGLNLIGFFFTFAIGLAWGAKYYRPELLASVEPFLVLFFGFYVAIAVLHALRAPEGRHGFVDGTLVFGTPLLAFPMQAAMLEDQPMALAYSALAVAVLYAVLAYRLLRVRKVALLGQSFGALAVGFATLAVPLAFSARWTCAAWALEGVALVWLGLRQQRVLPQIAGIALQGLAAMAYGASLLEGGWHGPEGEWPVVNGHAFCALLLCASAFALAWLYERAGKNRFWVWPGFIVGTFWWGWMGLREIEQHVAAFSLHSGRVGTASAWVAFVGITLLAMAGVRRVAHWPRPGWNVLLALGLSLPLALATQLGVSATLASQAYVTALHWPLAGYWLAWIVAALFALASLRTPLQRGIGFAHITFLLTLSLTYGIALSRGVRDAGLGADWAFVAASLPLTVLFVLTVRWPALGAFPLAREFAAYARAWFAIAGAVLGLAWVQSLALSGDVVPLPYLPLFNPVELLQLIGLIAAARWAWKRMPEQAPWLIAAAAFAFLSLAGLRGVHHYAGLPWSPSMLDSGIAQATLTVLWSIAGVVAWIAGSRRQHWGLWLAGAIGMGLVLVKLILVDRHYVGNIAGIVSFMAVGGLLVLVGRIAPTPPRHEVAKQEESE